MTTLYPNVARWSSLVPGVWEPEWTSTDHVLSDELPSPAGVGAVQIAARSLNLSLGDAAKLVANSGEASSLSQTALISHFSSAQPLVPFAALAGPASSTPNPGSYGGRLPVPPSVATGTPILGGDAARVSLLIQNNNGTGGANLLVSVDGPVDTGSPWAYMNFPPGQGIFMSQNAFTNPLYVAWGAGTVTGGVIFYGSAIASQTAGTKPQMGGAVAPVAASNPFNF